MNHCIFMRQKQEDNISNIFAKMHQPNMGKQAPSLSSEAIDPQTYGKHQYPHAVNQEDIIIDSVANDPVAYAGQNPYQVEQVPHSIQDNPTGNYPHPQQNHPHQPHQYVLQNGKTITVNGANNNVIIINDPSPPPPVKADPVWTRQQRIGCCCVSVDHHCYFCDFLCMRACCRCIQDINLCCYCHDNDCMHCCIYDTCRVCCLDKGICECILECCKHMPLCLCIECLSNGGCGDGLCQCLRDCNICDLINNCHCHQCVDCIGGICCGIIGCIFK